MLCNDSEFGCDMPLPNIRALGEACGYRVFGPVTVERLQKALSSAFECAEPAIVHLRIKPEQAPAPLLQASRVWQSQSSCEHDSVCCRTTGF